MKKDYNDGTIHGWNGGDCPVHPETVVEYWLRGEGSRECNAGNLMWYHDETAADIIAFCVIKEYVEPARPAASKVIWVNEYAAGYFAHENEEEARKNVQPSVHRIAVKYVECKE